MLIDAVAMYLRFLIGAMTAAGLMGAAEAGSGSMSFSRSASLFNDLPSSTFFDDLLSSTLFGDLPSSALFGDLPSSALFGDTFRRTGPSRWMRLNPPRSPRSSLFALRRNARFFWEKRRGSIGACPTRGWGKETEEEKLQSFREIRDEIKARIKERYPI